MYELKKIGKLFTSKFVATGPSSYKKRIHRAAVTQMLRNTALDDQVNGSSNPSVTTEDTVFLNRPSLSEILVPIN